MTYEEISANRRTPEKIAESPRLPLYGWADNIRSLYNVGSLFRSSDGANITKLFLSGFTPFPPRKEIDKTALGATNSVPWEYEKDPRIIAGHLHENRIKICVLELTDKSIPYYEVGSSDFPLCLVAGNEITGVSKEIMDEADMAVEIPMFGWKQSLNVAVAYGIVLYDFVRTLSAGEDRRRQR